MAARGPTHRSRRLGALATPWMLLLPALVMLVVFRLAPAIVGLAEAAYVERIGVNAGREFVGFGNFTRIFEDGVFVQSLKVTLLFNVVINAVQVISAFLLSLLINVKLPGVGLIRTIWLIPVAISLNVASAVWLIMYDPRGLFNGVLTALGFEAQPFLLDSGQALWAIGALATWIGVPLWSLFFLAGLQNIGADLEEAAMLDGASGWQTLWRIKVPLLRPAFVFVMTGATIANFLLFVPVFLMTQGGPNLSTNVLMFEAYRRGLVFGNFGIGSAMVVVLLIVTALSVALILRLGRER